MNENINLSKILKGHEGETFYCSLFGENVTFTSIVNSNIEITTKDKVPIELYSNGGFSSNGEIMLFPSKDQRDWNKWIKEQKSKVPKTWNNLIDKKDYFLEYKDTTRNNFDYEVTKPSHIEKAALALLKIHQLIEVGYGGNVTNKEWANSDGNNLIYVPFYNPIEKEFQSFGTFGLHRKSLIAFHTHKQIKEFLKYLENVQLLRDYSMV